MEGLLRPCMARMTNFVRVRVRDTEEGFVSGKFLVVVVLGGRRGRDPLLRRKWGAKGAVLSSLRNQMMRVML